MTPSRAACSGDAPRTRARHPGRSCMLTRSHCRSALPAGIAKREMVNGQSSGVRLRIVVSIQQRQCSVSRISLLPVGRRGRCLRLAPDKGECRANSLRIDRSRKPARHCGLSLLNPEHYTQSDTRILPTVYWAVQSTSRGESLNPPHRCPPTVVRRTQRRSARPANTFAIFRSCTAACPFTNTHTMPVDSVVGST